MSEMTEDRSYKFLVGIIVGALVLSALLAVYKFMPVEEIEQKTPTAQEQKRRSVVLPPVVDYNRMKKDENLQSLMDQRKETYRVGDGVDLVLKSDESIKIGDLTVTMQEIEDKIRLKTGDVLENDLTDNPAATPPRSDRQEDKDGAGQTTAATPSQADGSLNENQGDTIRAYGIHIVQSGDNIWNIHFNFIKNYYIHRGISVEPLADESSNQGFSSGIGRILKFSENMVYIFNLKEKKLDVNLNMIHPMTKIVVFNMQRVFSLLDQVDYTYVSRIEFDGETIWIPSAQK